MKQDKAGLEVYFKPLGPDFRSTKFLEVPLNATKKTDRHMECSIPKFKGSFRAVLRFTDDFEMPDGSALYAEMSMQGLSGTGQSGTRKSLVSTRRADQGQKLFGRSSRSGKLKFISTTEGFKKVKGRTKVPLHGNEAKAGTILVTITRVHSNWEDESADRYGSGDPRLPRRWANKRYVPLDGELGEPFEFVYRPLAKSAFQKAVQKCPNNPQPDVLNPVIPGFTRDLEYVADLQAADRKLEELCEAWNKKQAEIAAGSSLIQSSQPNTATNAIQTPLKSPNVVQQALSISPLRTTPEALIDTAGPTKPATPVTRRAKRSKPTICTCPVEHHTTSRRPQKSRDTEISSDSDSPAVQPKQSFRPRKAEKTKETPEFEPPEASKESATVACGQCKQIKKAPRGKKIAFRNARRRYMYVPQSAPDDDELEDEAPNNHVQQVDEDDEEAPPQEDRKVMETLRSSSDTAGLGSPDVPMSDSGVVPQPDTDGPGSQTQELTVSERVITTTTENSATGEADVVVMPQVTVEDSETTEPTPTTESTVASDWNEPPPKTTSENRLAFELRAEEHEGATEITAAEQTVTQQETAKPPEETNGDVPTHSSASTAPHTLVGATGREQSNKRTATPAYGERESKRQRIEVDLTNDDDGDMILVKTEKLENENEAPSTQVNTTEDRYELEARLRKVVMQQKQLKLQFEEAELRQKLRQLTEGNGSAASEQKGAVKVEIVID